jgi:FMN phosphatase YigB (HAD superfamily)
MALRAWLFDLDDTLIPEAPAIRAGYEAVAKRVWGQSTPERVRRLTDAAHEVWRAGAPWEYKERVHFSLGEGLHGEFVADGPEPDLLRQFVPRLHDQAFEAVLPQAWRGRSAELVDTWRRARMSALSLYPETREVLTGPPSGGRLGWGGSGRRRGDRGPARAAGALSVSARACVPATARRVAYPRRWCRSP